MMFALGVVVFALGIAISIALHEAGHMWTAQKLGMKVRRYYIGFGPRVFAFRRGETEYGLKAVPAGGFCDIAGMTALDELAPDEVDRAMYKQKTWKRLVVMSGGIAMNFLLGIVLVYGLAASAGLPNTDNRAVVGTVGCAAPTQDGPPDYTPADCSGPGPAEQAGIAPGDVIVAVDGQPVETFDDLVRATQPLSGTVPFTVERGDETLTVPVTVQQVQRWVYESESPDAEPVSRTVGAIGVGGEPGIIEYTPLSAIPATLDFTGYLAARTAEALVSLPSKVADLWTAVTGGEACGRHPGQRRRSQRHRWPVRRARHLGIVRAVARTAELLPRCVQPPPAAAARRRAHGRRDLREGPQLAARPARAARRPARGLHETVAADLRGGGHRWGIHGAHTHSRHRQPHQAVLICAGRLAE